MKATTEDIRRLSEYLEKLRNLTEHEPPQISEEDEERARNYFLECGSVPDDLIGQIEFTPIPGGKTFLFLPGYDTAEIMAKVEQLTAEGKTEELSTIEGLTITDEPTLEVSYPNRDKWENDIYLLYLEFSKNNAEIMQKVAAPILSRPFELGAELTKQDKEKLSISPEDIEKRASTPEEITKILAEVEETYHKSAQEIDRLPQLAFLPNTGMMNLFFKIFANGENISQNFVSRGERLSVTKYQKELVVRREKGEKSQQIKITNVDKLTYKASKTTVYLFCYIMQKLSYQKHTSELYLSFEELVDIGIFATIESARHGVDFFYNQMTGKNNGAGVWFSGEEKKGKKPIKQDDGLLFYHKQKTVNGVVLYLNDKLNFDIFMLYYTFFPSWAYSLDNLKAFLLVRYIFFLARQNGENLKEPEHQIKGRETKVFSISFEAIRDALGLPTPAEVREKHGRKYPEKIKKPLEKAIEDIENAIAPLSPSEAVLLTLTPLGIDNAANIEEFLRCSLEVGIDTSFAQNFSAAADLEEKNRAKLSAEIRKQEAKMIVKNQQKKGNKKTHI